MAGAGWATFKEAREIVKPLQQVEKIFERTAPLEITVTAEYRTAPRSEGLADL
jgi:hypothetical protein